MQEAERLLRLRQQDGRPLRPPPGLEAFASSGSLEPWKLPEARQVWAATRSHLAAVPSDLAAAERLVFLTLLLANTLSTSGDDEGLRAIYEGALEVLTLPRHRQLMRGYLARQAARTNDLESAEAWLAGCDPGSDDLMADSTYRVSRAYLETAYGRPQIVLQVLGSNDQDVPVEDMMDAIATVLRANAWERMGNVDVARQQLLRFMQAGKSAGIEGVIGAMPTHWQVCARSLQAARLEHRVHVGARASGNGVVGWILMGIGLLTGLLFLAPAVALFLDGRIQGLMPLIAALVCLVLVAGAGFNMVLGARRAKRIASDGFQGKGRILGVSPSGTRVNHVPLMKITVQVHVPGHPPTEAAAKKLIPESQATMLIGCEVPCVWHPAHPREVVLDL